MAVVTQPVLPLTPAEATPIGPIAALVDKPGEGSVVYVNGLATFCFDAGDEVGRRLAAVQLVETEIARPSQVASGFAVTRDTLWRWRCGFAAEGVAGLVPGRPGPTGPIKLTDEVVARIRELERRGWSLAAIGAETGVSTATVRVALGRRRGSVGWEARNAAARSQIVVDAESACAASLVAGEVESTAAAHQFAGDTDEQKTAPMLPVLADPVPRTDERALARYGLLTEAEPVFTQGARLPLAGLWLVLPALAVTGLLEVFTDTYGRLRNGFYGLRPVVLTLLFLALLRDPRAEGLTIRCSSRSSARLRPPPGRRDRPRPGPVPSAASLRPRRTVSAATPHASATIATPPGPNSAASAPSHNRRWNSDKCGRSTAYRRATESTKSAIPQK